MSYNIGRGAGGALSGAATGAAVGSVVPGIGTGIGATVGGLAGLFGGFSGNRKTDWGSLMPNPPHLNLEDYDLYLNQWDDLINEYDSIKTGQNMFDAVKFLYEPQKAELNRLYGINTAPGDTAARMTGALPQLKADLNKRGLLDAGTSGILEEQVYADENRQLADLFGQAKQIQRSDYFNALGKLEGLYPERFEIKNIPNYLDYFNDTNDYNVALQRNAATESSDLARRANEASYYSNLLGGLGGGSNGLFGFGNTAQGYNQRANMIRNMSMPQMSNSAPSFGGGSNGGGLIGNAMNWFGGNVNEPPGMIATSSGMGYRKPYQSPSSESSLVTKESPGMTGMDNKSFSGLLKSLLSMGSGGSVGGGSGIGSSLASLLA